MDLSGGISPRWRSMAGESEIHHRETLLAQRAEVTE
jgi:hypothetical protein